ncbi:MAG TPA: DNA topoisomerase IB [Burkholderiales bacterium]|jgi:DNA topoisomerase-1
MNRTGNGKSYTRLPALPAESARAAGLRYVSDAVAGIERRAARMGFRYLASDGAAVRDKATLARIRALAVPPAWTDVWICPREDGHLQATGRDARRRKQYRYHPRWREVRDESKYGRLVAFGRALPRIRRRVARDLARPGLPREKVLATLVRLLETTYIRIGNEEYARDNESFGLTTLRERQVRVAGAQLRFRFRGKSGVPHEIALTDRRIAQIVRRMQDLPGQELFQYVDEDGSTRAIESTDVNAYLKSVAGEEFTSKDFRTWAGTLLCARALRRLPPPQSAAAGRREVAQAIAAVARELRNTRAVCRKCYVHPAIIESYLEGRLQRAALLSLLGGKRKRLQRERSLAPARRLLEQITIPARSKPCGNSSAASRQSSP